MVMTLAQARKCLSKLDEMLDDEIWQRDRLLNGKGSSRSAIGSPQFDSLPVISHAIRSRHTEIIKVREQIHHLKQDATVHDRIIRETMASLDLAVPV